MDGSGLNINTVQLVNAAEGFSAASTETQRHADALDAALKPYALKPDMFQGPQADEFRRLYREIWDDLASIKTEAMAMSNLVDEAKTQFSKIATQAGSQIPRSGGGGPIVEGLTPQASYGPGA